MIHAHQGVCHQCGHDHGDGSLLFGLAAPSPTSNPTPQPSDLAVRILALKRKGSSGSDYYGADDSWNDAIEAAAALVSAAARKEQG